MFFFKISPEIHTMYDVESVKKANLTLEQHWSLTQALPLWPTSSPQTSAGPPLCWEARQSWSAQPRTWSDCRRWVLSAPETCSPPHHAPFPRLTLEVLVLLKGGDGWSLKEIEEVLHFIELLPQLSQIFWWGDHCIPLCIRKVHISWSYVISSSIYDFCHSWQELECSTE